MFEGNPISAASIPHGDGTALRAIGWSELTARINAARDLRQVLRRDSATFVASFGDAAAGFFAELGDGKQAVNLDALGHCKSTRRMDVDSEGDAATGDREK
ncbi:hypothetical protein P7228_06655 [Altererythrobacter arenosus]|uniref:Uncharacterized protein n=1 Tax=Altererythrobacter arenosus TaxID=3032592 RepID=A0ABY8G1U3_9SPHN|nr:hypothetical protein [Altererythrobacter sp. CAU 1644]WFL78739.1 hypothetical protein P7228_06655 [Altererythrobacter sp. CAU 1644]